MGEQDTAALLAALPTVLTTALPIGIHLDGVLVHDGLPMAGHPKELAISGIPDDAADHALEARGAPDARLESGAPRLPARTHQLRAEWAALRAN